MRSTYLAARLQLEDEIRRDRRLTPSARNIGVELVRRRNSTDGQCNPSVATIAESTGCSPRTVNAALNDLEKANWIRRTPGKGRSVNHYTIPRLEEPEGGGPGTGHAALSRQNCATTERLSRENCATTEPLSRNSCSVVAQKTTSLSRKNCAQSLIEISASDLSVAPAPETTSPRKAFEADCRRMVEPEPIMLAQDFHVIEELLDREGLRPEDIRTGISEALERRSDPSKRFRHWRQMVGWCRQAATNRLAKGPRADPSAGRPIVDDPDDPMLEFPGGFKRRTSFVVKAVAAWHARPESWPMNALGAPPGSPGCRVPPSLLKDLDRAPATCS